MESVGDEKKIQALFSELSFEDKTRAPRFEKLWLGAGETARVPTPVRMRSVPVTGALVVLVAGSLLAASSWYRSSQSHHAVNIPPQSIPTLKVPGIEQPANADERGFRAERPRKVLRPRQTGRLAANEVATLSIWQSPTRIFLQSPTASALSSLPQLDQSARDLQTFLPRNTEVLKESKQ